LVERKQIYYDTTGFQVAETRVYHLCPQCPGYTEVVAEGLNRHLHGFSAPFNSCGKCRVKARDAFAKTKKEANTITVLQDRVAGIYETK
jgi:hypothetical protein